jgi:hypothetical protein
MLHEAYGDGALHQTITYESFKCFKSESTLMGDDEQSG